jgi:MFS family permease
MVISGVIAGALIRKVGPKIPMILGAVAVTIAFVIPALGHGEEWQIVVSGILTGIGIGMALAATSNAIVESVPATQTGEAISANTVLRTIGSSIGTAVIAAFISSNVTPQGAPSDDAFTIGFWVSAGVGVLALLAALLVPSRVQAAPGMLKLRASTTSTKLPSPPAQRKTPAHISVSGRFCLA